jgi:dihydroorotate dehydrogenase electron transfer subunit
MSLIKNVPTTIFKKHRLSNGYYRFEVGPFPKVSAITPGQFIHLKIPDTNIYFRRAFSVYDINPETDTIEIIFKVFGRGTALLAKLRDGDVVDILGPLGNGFTLPRKNETAVMVAGGIGMPPIYFLAKHLIEKGYDPDKILYFYGGNTKDDLVDIARIRKIGVKLYSATLNGSSGFKGLVTEAIMNKIDLNAKNIHFFACGPEGMLKAVDDLARKHNIPGQLSLEAPMPCGIGVCLGCIRPLREGGYTRVCREGPVYNIGEVIL